MRLLSEFSFAQGQYYSQWGLHEVQLLLIENRIVLIMVFFFLRYINIFLYFEILVTADIWLLSQAISVNCYFPLMYGLDFSVVCLVILYWTWGISDSTAETLGTASHPLLIPIQLSISLVNGLVNSSKSNPCLSDPLHLPCLKSQIWLSRKCSPPQDIQLL